MIIDCTYDNKTMPTGTIKATHCRADGSIVKQVVQDIDSFVINNWNSYVFGIHTGAGTRLAWDAGGGLNAYNSIILGSGSTAPAYANTALVTQILHGNTTGRLQANAPTVAFDSATGEAKIERLFENIVSGSTVTVRECGIRVASGNATGSTDGLLIIRDTFDSDFTLNHTDSITIEYKITLPYGSINYHRLFSQHLICRTNNNMVLINQSNAEVQGTFGSGNDALNFTTFNLRNARGIVLGTGSTAASFADVEMDAEIAHGTSAGQFVYGECTNTTVTSNTTTSNFSQWYLIRYFENRSGSNINVNEIGLVSNATINSTNQVYLYDRRVLPSTVEVADNTIITAIWKFRYDF
jgi:hypothetical protein